MPEGSATRTRAALAIGAALAVLTAAAYARVAGNAFINLDDNDYVTASPHVQAGLTWSSIRWAKRPRRLA